MLLKLMTLSIDYFMENLMQQNNKDQGLEEMVAEYMEKGFLENIVDMFKHDKGLIEIVPTLFRDERIKVRIGVIALIESLKEIEAAGIDELADILAPLLSDDKDLVKGDSAYALGIIGKTKHIPYLQKLLSHENKDIAESAQDAIDEIESREIA